MGVNSFPSWRITLYSPFAFLGNPFTSSPTRILSSILICFLFLKLKYMVNCTCFVICPVELSIVVPLRITSVGCTSFIAITLICSGGIGRIVSPIFISLSGSKDFPSSRRKSSLLSFVAPSETLSKSSYPERNGSITQKDFSSSDKFISST